MKRLIYALFGAPVNRYFRWGVRYLVKMTSAFNREIALEQAMNLVQSGGVQGNYLEFGVYKGRNFAAACFLARERKLAMQFWAFDSFEGLPTSEGEFQEGQYQCSCDVFLGNVKQCLGDLSGVRVVPGWFSESLVPDNPALVGLGKVAIAWVDCDLYESSKPVLEFLTTRLQDGALIFFDDWFCFKGRPDCGEQRACQEWLDGNPQIRLIPYSRFGWSGQSFIVNFTG